MNDETDAGGTTWWLREIWHVPTRAEACEMLRGHRDALEYRPPAADSAAYRRGYDNGREWLQDMGYGCC